MGSEKVITSKKDLARYLAKHNPHMLEVFTEFAKEFGPAKVVAYIEAEDDSIRPENDHRKNQSG